MSISSKTEPVRLTQFSHGAGCGCKIAPGVLETIIGSPHHEVFKDLMVGNSSKDDAAVMAINDDEAIISTTDFFMPIVDDAFDFGRIASTNAISDVYAMGGRPLMAIAILGWPINDIEPEVASKVLDGARAVCKEAGMPLAGGHSIDCPEPIFGLAVTGIANKKNIKTNTAAQEGDLLYLTKPIGVGILSTAAKKGLISSEHLQNSVDTMSQLNKIGQELGELGYVHAITDVTGFGVLGHAIEMCEGSNVSARLNMGAISVLPGVGAYLDQGAIPGGTHRNWKSYGHKVGELSEKARTLLSDPQTSGGLLVAIDPSKSAELEALFAQNGLGALKPIGSMSARGEHIIAINE